MENEYHNKCVKMKDSTINYQDTIKIIAKEIEALKRQYPQLIDFDSDKNADPENLIISYNYKTHKPKPTVGWRGAVPEPDNKGIWFHINLHDIDSQSQIDTQPVMPYSLYIGKKLGKLIPRSS